MKNVLFMAETTMILSVVLLVVAAVLLAFAVAILVIAKKAKSAPVQKEEEKEEKIKVVDGVRYAEEPSVKKVSHREGDFVLAVGKTAKAEKDGELLPGQYTVLAGADGAEAFNVRVGGFVREFHHGDTIVLADDDEITAVSHTIVLR